MIIKYVKGMNEEWNGWWESENNDKKCKRNEGDNKGVKVIMKNMKGAKVSESDEEVIKQRGSKRNDIENKKKVKKKLISIVLVIEKQ
jgi:hypothetical protein